MRTSSAGSAFGWQKRKESDDIKPWGDKVMRLHAQTGAIENGFIHLPREAHYDDQIDSTSQVLAWTNQRFPGWGILEFYQRQADQLRTASK